MSPKGRVRLALGIIGCTILWFVLLVMEVPFAKTIAAVVLVTVFLIGLVSG